MLSLKQISDELKVGIIYNKNLDITDSDKIKPMTFVDKNNKEYKRLARWGQVIVPGFEMFNERFLINFNSELTPEKIKNYYVQLIHRFISDITEVHEKSDNIESEKTALLKYNAEVMWSLNHNNSYYEKIGYNDSSIQWL